MLENELCPADALRTPASALLPDERTTAFAVIDQGMVRNITQADHHGAIARFELSSSVPIAVRIHFETAIVLLAANGLENKEIAAEMGVGRTRFPDVILV